jgi:hypothetical protein
MQIQRSSVSWSPRAKLIVAPKVAFVKNIDWIPKGTPFVIFEIMRCCYRIPDGNQTCNPRKIGCRKRLGVKRFPRSSPPTSAG